MRQTRLVLAAAITAPSFCGAFMGKHNSLLFGANYALSQNPSTNHRRHPPELYMADIVDAEYSHDETDGGSQSKRPKTLVDVSLESDPEMKDIIVEFVEMTPSGNRKYIDCKLPFVADLDGVTYSIGTPHDPTIAILSNGGDGETIMLDADDDSKEEIFQIAAAALVENMGEDFRLKRTPRILTVEGDLDAYTSQWIQEEKIETKDLLNEDDENDQFFDDFFKEQLGPNYREEFLIDEQDDDEAAQLLKMFEIPGLGTEEQDEGGIEKMLKEMISGEVSEVDEDTDSEQAKALPLFPFSGPDGKMYAFVQMAQPILLVGKEDPSIDKDQRLLLHSEEAERILPRLKSEFRDLMDQLEVSD